MKEEGATENSSILQLLPFGNLNIFYAKAICNIFFFIILLFLSIMIRIIYND